MPLTTKAHPELTDKDIRRFWSKVDQGQPEGCWLWTAGKFGNGHGAFAVQGKNKQAHSVAFFLRHGYVPERHRHTCGNPLCCNPGHVVDEAAAPVAVRHKRPYATEDVFRLKAGGLRQVDIAVRLGISQTTVSLVLGGKRRVRLPPTDKQGRMLAVSNDRPLLVAYNNHDPSCGEPTSLVDGPETKEYLGYFVNHYGEQWLFRYDFDVEKGVVLGGDADWGKAYPVLDGVPINLIINREEQLWLAACWRAATVNRAYRDEQRGTRPTRKAVPTDLAVAQRQARREAETLGYDWEDRPEREHQSSELEDEPYILDYSFCADLIAHEKRPTPQLEAYALLLKYTYFPQTS